MTASTGTKIPSPAPGTARPLRGRCVLVTRPERESEGLGARLSAAGAHVIHYPMLSFEPPLNPGPLDRSLADLARYDWVVFTSRRAVDSVLDRDPVRPAGLKVAAVGPATAGSLRDRGWSVDLVPPHATAETLVTSLDASGVGAGTRVLFPAGSLARDVLPKGIERLGARVDQVEAYRTVPVSHAAAELRERLEAGGVDAVTFTSPSAVAAFGESLGDDLPRALDGLPLVTIGPTTTRALQGINLTAAQARSSTLEGVVDEVTRVLADAPAQEWTDDRSRELLSRATGHIPGGVNSPVRAFGSVGGVPPFITRAHGSRIWDVDGHEYVDFVNSWGVMILGHDHPSVRAAVSRALGNGTSFGAPTEAEVQLAELVCRMVPGIDTVRLVNSGTEATMSTVRLARAATGAARVIKFRGGYHGHADLFLVEAGSGASTLGVPSSPGVTVGTTADTLIAEYNDLASVEALFAAHPNDVACVIVEPVAGNMGCIPPRPGFLEGLRELCTANDALLVFDEVITGFRLAPGGAQERFGVMPDLTTLGKIIGGGIPIGAYGGRDDLMRMIAPEGPVYQAGTLSGNPLATAAGIAVLTILNETPHIYEHLETMGRKLDAGLRDVIAVRGYPLTWNRIGSMGSLFFTDRQVHGWPEAETCDRDRFARFFHGLLRRGIYIAPSPFETTFISAAHTEDDVECALIAIESSLAEAFDS